VLFTGERLKHAYMRHYKGADHACTQVVWTAGEADAVVMTRLKNASVIHGFHEEKVCLRMSVARADTPGDAVSAANFDGGEEEVQVKLAVELLPPKVRVQWNHVGRQLDVLQAPCSCMGVGLSA
jgi:hypothetical protein